ncbi:hypothetical protein QBC42DRAFT_329051 [Cladorrhinum samala]|uniref:Uncharacterized protein n=1 Tax=Cladorrhinum samala TaxID=585594 RepID=A0AAV9HLV5_9PEZI|nr:hypothetical protein QBC42DRAFT_329051 [Cladorrhinum samala]
MSRDHGVSTHDGCRHRHIFSQVRQASDKLQVITDPSYLNKSSWYPVPWQHSVDYKLPTGIPAWLPKIGYNSKRRQANKKSGEPSQQQRDQQQEKQQHHDEAVCWKKPVIPRSECPTAEQAVVPSSVCFKLPPQHTRVQRLKEEHGMTPSANYLPQVLQQPAQHVRVTRSSSSSNQKKQQSLPAFEELVRNATAPPHRLVTRSARSLQASRETLTALDTPAARQQPSMADPSSHQQPPTSNAGRPQAAEDGDHTIIPSREIAGRTKTARPSAGKGTKRQECWDDPPGQPVPAADPDDVSSSELTSMIIASSSAERPRPPKRARRRK